MANKTEIRGLVAYPITPFDQEVLDLVRLKDLVRDLISSGSDAIAPLGSTGEAAYLSLAEWKAVVDATVEATAGNVPVVVGSSDLTTSGTIERAQYAQAAGADAVMVAPISYWALKEKEIFGHYSSIGASIDIPVVVYNNPATAGVDMSPELLVHMFESIPNVTTVKESTGDITRMNKLRELTAGTLPFLNGSNPLILDAVEAGAVGWSTAAMCLLPQPIKALYVAASNGDTARAKALYEELKPFLQFIVKQGLPSAIKTGLSLQGAPAGDPRLPLLPVSEEDTRLLSSMLTRSYSL